MGESGSSSASSTSGVLNPSAPSTGRGPGSSSGPVGPHLWQIRAVRDVVLLAAGWGLLQLLLKIQAAVIPILIAFVLAYVLDPLITHAEDKWGWSRGPLVVTSLVVLLAFNTLFFWLIVPRVVAQLIRLTERLPDYLSVLRTDYGLSIPVIDDFDRFIRGLSSQSPEQIAELFGGAGRVVATLSSVLGTTLSLVTGSLLTLVVFAFFALRFPRLPSIRPYLPGSQREAWWNRLKQVEGVFAGFIRGQLMVMVFTSTVFSLGFGLSGVPYWFVASALGGLFSIIPYGQGVGFVLAVAFNFFEARTGSEDVSWGFLLLGPGITYALMQSLETFVVTPLVQGSFVRLHPVAVLVAVIAGGGLGGLLGVFLAIPLAAVVRIFVLDVWLPWLRRWAEAH